MRLATYIITAILVLAHSMTAVIGEPGGLGYELVLKPYPSMLKSIPGMEEGSWKKEVSEGSIPQWVVARNYIVLGYGDGEQARKALWEPIYAASYLATLLFTIVSLTLLIRYWYWTRRSTGTTRKRVVR